MSIAPSSATTASQLVSTTLRAAAAVTGMQLVYVASIDAGNASTSAEPTPAPTYTFAQLQGTFPGVSVGMSLPLSDTFCARMLAGAPTSTANAATDDAYAGTPAREALGITSYVGIALRQSGAVTGTLCGIDTASVSLAAPELRVMAALGRVLSAESARDPEVRLHRTATGWEVEEADGSLTAAESLAVAMSLADLIAAETGEIVPTQRPQRPRESVSEVEQLRLQVSQLEHALNARVVIEQAIGVVAQRFGLSPREAFDRLRKSARSRGQRVHDLAVTLVKSARDTTVVVPRELR